MGVVAALAQRAYAGGHGDLRPDFFDTPEDQRLTVSRLEKQRPAVAILPTGDNLFGFKRDFFLVAPFLYSHYRVFGEIEIDDRTKVLLLVTQDRPVTGSYRETGWPCFR